MLQPWEVLDLRSLFVNNNYNLPETLVCFFLSDNQNYVTGLPFHTVCQETQSQIWSWLLQCCRRQVGSSFPGLYFLLLLMFSLVLFLYFYFYFTVIFYSRFLFESPLIFCGSKIEINKNNNPLWLHELSLLTTFQIHFLSPFLFISGKRLDVSAQFHPRGSSGVLWSAMASSLSKSADNLFCPWDLAGGYCFTTKRAKSKLLYLLNGGSLCHSVGTWLRKKCFFGFQRCM